MTATDVLTWLSGDMRGRAEMAAPYSRPPRRCRRLRLHYVIRISVCLLRRPRPIFVR
ncbi:hypothetical protein HRbin36_02684 [bacterium HR36]|nr:hypothetical protein HRbin36_02684 [bacterium HR36]